MKLPNGASAAVELRKLLDYCLSPTHPRGRHKARVFAAALGWTAADAEDLRSALLLAAASSDATPAGEDPFGKRYVIDSRFDGPSGTRTIRSTWIILRHEVFPRLTSCYVL